MTSSNSRFSTYSGAPSLQPSLAPTYRTSSNRSSTQRYSSRFSPQALLTPKTNPEPDCAAIYTSSALASSSLSLSSTDPKTAELQSFADLLDRMTDTRVDKQRFVMSMDKTEEVSKNALGAKVLRALARRMSGQDAIFARRKSLSLSLPIDEKRALEVEAI